MGKNDLRGFVWVIFAVIMFVQVIATFSTEGIAPIAPFYLNELSLSRSQVGLLTAGIFLGMGLLSAFSGRLVDRYGVRNVLSIGMLVISASALFFSTVKTFPAAWILAFLGGLAYSVDQPGTVKAVVTWFPKRVWATIICIKQSGVALGQVMAALVLVPLAGLLGWRLAMVVASAMALLAAFLVYSIYREADNTQNDHAATGASPWRILAQNRNLKLLLLSGPFRMAATYSVVSYLVLFLVENTALSTIQAAKFLGITTISSAVARVGWGVVSDLLGGKRKTILVLISLFGIAGTLVFVFLPIRSLSVALLSLGCILLGVGLSGGIGVYTVAIAEASGEGNTGAMVGLSGTATCLGIVIGPPVFGWIVDKFGSYQPAWAFLAVFAIFALVNALCLRSDESASSVQHNDVLTYAKKEDPSLPGGSSWARKVYEDLSG